jgi:hypothetical protein
MLRPINNGIHDDEEATLMNWRATATTTVTNYEDYGSVVFPNENLSNAKKPDAADSANANNDNSLQVLLNMEVNHPSTVRGQNKLYQHYRRRVVFLGLVGCCATTIIVIALYACSDATGGLYNWVDLGSL